jgi:5-methylcytosine-specific restriction endonuclease McrA
MPKLQKIRNHAFQKQHGRCFYCGQPMWSRKPDEIVAKYQIKPDQAKLLKCTGEHLKAKQEGGDVSQNNIVAACLFCNQTRHKRKSPLPPDRYKKLVHNRLKIGAWHGIQIHQPV